MSTAVKFISMYADLGKNKIKLIGITSDTFILSENTRVLTHKLNRSLIIGEIIGQASLITLVSMSHDKVAFLILI